MKKIIKNEQGKVLILVLILLVAGGLLLTPLLGLMSTGLVAGQVYETKTKELYAADAGIEHGIWSIQTNTNSPTRCDRIKVWDPFAVNDLPVYVTVSWLSTLQYHIRSIAGNTEIVAVLDLTLAFGDDSTFEHYSGGNVEYDSSVFLQDDAVEGNVENYATVVGYGDIVIHGNIENYVTVCIYGDLTVYGNIENYSSVYVEGNLTADKIEDEVLLCVGGTITAILEGGTFEPVDGCSISCPTISSSLSVAAYNIS